MYFDGSVMKEGAGVGLVFISSLGVRMEYLVRLHFPASNNTAEYEALINDLRIAVLEIKCLEMLMVKIRQPSHEFTFGVGISFIYPLVLTPMV
jgi:hypothetical protein